MKRLLFLNLLLVLVMSGCNVITSGQTYVDGKPVDAVPTPVEVIEPVVTNEPSEGTVVEDEPIPVETGDYQTGGFYQNWIAFVDVNNNIAMLNPVSGELKQITEGGGSAVMNAEIGSKTFLYRLPTWSSDGEFLAFQQEINTQKSDMVDITMNLWVYDPVNETSNIVLENEYLSGYSWKPDSHVISYTVLTEPGYFTGRGVVDASLAHGIMLVDVDSGEISELVAPQGFSLVQPQWSPDGSLVSFDEVYLMEGRGNFAWYDLITSSYHRRDTSIGNYDWSPAGDLLAYDNLTYIPGGEERILLNDRMGNAEKLFSSSVEAGNFAFSPRFSPNGAQLAYLIGNGSLDEVNSYQLVVQAMDSSQAQMLLEGDHIGSFSWSGDGSFLAVTFGPYGSSEIVIIDVLNGTNSKVAQGWDPVWQK